MSNELVELATQFGISSDLLTIEPIDVGYEDSNYVLVNSDSSWVLKVFRPTRSASDIETLIDAIRCAQEQTVNHPALLANVATGCTLSTHSGIAAICMERVKGRTLFEEDAPLGFADVDEFVDQLSRLRRSRSVRVPEIDPWSFRCLEYSRSALSKILEGDDLSLVKSAMRRFETVSHTDLPVGFAHGDLVPTNIVRGERLFLIDFGRAGVRPLADEIAIAIAQSFLPTDGSAPDEIVATFVDALRASSLLTNSECVALPALVGAVNAGFMVGACQLRTSPGNALTGETLYWYERSRRSLEWALDWCVNS